MDRRMIRCEHCLEKFDPATEPGGLAFGPPDESDRCEKWHLCKECWKVFIRWMTTGRVDR